MIFSTVDLLVLLLGAALGGFVNGLTGFGTALTAVPIWIHAMPPPIAAALGAAAGIIGQVQTIHLVRHAIEWRIVAPFIVPGLLGVPIGTYLLPLIDVRLFKLGVGAVLIVYCGFNLLAARLARTGIAATGGRLADGVVGLGGGIMSGIAGLSGPLPIMWATFKPWSRDAKRALFQTYNLSILLATVVSSTMSGLLPSSFWLTLLASIPVTVVSVRLGAMTYRHLDDRRFDRVVVALMLAMGVSLIVTSW